MESQFLHNILIIFGVAVGILIVFRFLKLPHVISYLLTGILLSPNTTDILHGAEEIEAYAEIGVMLLLFTVGLEFSFANLKKIQKYVFWGGISQVLLTIFFSVIAVIVIVNLPVNVDIFWGFTWALSSTAIVIKILQDKNQLNTTYGKFILAVLLFQDLIIVPMMLFVPILAGKAETPWLEITFLIGKLGVFAILAFLLSKYVIPFLLRQIKAIKSEEAFLITIIFVVIGIASLTSFMGLSLALGAFIAGLIIAETDYQKKAISFFLPFRHVFMSFFFIAIGMLLDYTIFLAEWKRILFWISFTLIMKVATGFFSAKMMKLSVKDAFIVGLSLAQIGEFSFVLVQSGLEFGLVDPVSYQVFLAVSIVVMTVSPLLIMNASSIAEYLEKKFGGKLPISNSIE